MRKINKTAARKLWNEKKEFVIVSCNLRPEYGIRVRSEWTKLYRDFDHFLTYFDAHNCGDSERGRYAAYYVDE